MCKILKISRSLIYYKRKKKNNNIELENKIKQIFKEMSLIVGNDISWSQIQFLNSKFDDVIFTNHNAAALPFKEDSFEIAYCSNTLHHMPNKITLVNM